MIALHVVQSDFRFARLCMYYLTRSVHLPSLDKLHCFMQLELGVARCMSTPESRTGIRESMTGVTGAAETH